MNMKNLFFDDEEYRTLLEADSLYWCENSHRLNSMKNPGNFSIFPIDELQEDLFLDNDTEAGKLPKSSVLLIHMSSQTIPDH